MKFKDFQVYKDAKISVTLIFQATRKFPREYYYLSDQMNWTGLSIVLNIAEGSAKSSNKDFRRFLQNSLGSATETIAALEIAKDFGLIEENSYQQLMSLLEKIVKQLGGFSKFLDKN